MIAGQPRRYFDFADAFIGWNSLITYGSIVSVLSILLLAGPVTVLVNTPDTRPTSAATLDWMLPATPSSHAFTQLPYLRNGLAAPLIEGVQKVQQIKLGDLRSRVLPFGVE